MRIRLKHDTRFELSVKRQTSKTSPDHAWKAAAIGAFGRHAALQRMTGSDFTKRGSNLRALNFACVFRALPHRGWLRSAAPRGGGGHRL